MFGPILFASLLALSPESYASESIPLKSLLQEAREAQRLVSTYDARLENISEESALDQLQASSLYCRILDARTISESRDHKLEEIFQHAFRKREEASAFKDLFAFAQTDAAAAAATGQILKQLTASETEICGTQGCVSSLIGDELPFSLEDEKFANYLANHQQLIAYPASPELDGPGECAVASSRRASYDWNKRNWISGNLINGEFVVTYDDGPHVEYTSQIQAAWSATSFAKPAFFWLSANSLAQQELVQRTHREGFPVACHSERHADLGNLAKAATAANLSKVNRETFGTELKNVSPAEFSAWKSRTLDREILGAKRAIEDIVRQTDPSFRLKHYRLPFGSGLKNDLIGSRFAAADLDHFFWRVDSLDWQDKNSASVHKRVLSQMKSGKKGIILFHDIQAPTVKTTQLLLETFTNSAEWKPVSIRRMVP